MRLICTQSGFTALALLVAFGIHASSQAVPTPVTVPQPVELPNPPQRLVVHGGFTITLDKAVDWFRQQNPELRAARDGLAQARVQKNKSTGTSDAAIAQAELKIAELKIAELARRGLFDLKRTYYEAVLARLLILETEENLRFLDTYANRMQTRLEEKMGPESDVMKWRVERSRVADALAEMKLAERLARIRFFNLLGTNNSTAQQQLYTYLDTPPAQAPAVQVEQLFERGLRERPDLRALEITAAPPFPEKSEHQKPEIAPGNRTRPAQFELEAVRNQIFAEIEAALAAVETHRERALAIKAQQTAQTESLRSVSATFYYEGEAPLIVLLDAQRARWEARQQYQRALCAYYIGLAQLEAAVGESLKEIAP